jgi:transcriptional regulator with XRE-family HTH domain
VSSKPVTTDAAATEQAHIGRALRALRQERGLSLKQVAEATDISVSFLSLVESGGSDITFGRLRRLLRLYGKTPNDLVDDISDTKDVVVRGVEQPFLFSLDDGITGYLAVPNTTGLMLAARVDFEPAATMHEPSNHHGEEWVLVAQGEVRVDFEEGVSFTLGAGDTIQFDCRRPHRFTNVGRSLARTYSVVTTGIRGHSVLGR